MRHLGLLPILLLCCLPWAAFAGGPYTPGVLSDADHALLQAWAQEGDSTVVKGENTRLISSALAVFLGPFGAHRLYLGTTPKVAVIYGITFGGFGLLALLDLGHLLFTKDLEPYRNNDKVFMWAPQTGATPP